MSTRVYFRDFTLCLCVDFTARSGVARGGTWGGGKGPAAVGAPPQTPGRLLRKTVAGGSA